MTAHYPVYYDSHEQLHRNFAARNRTMGFRAHSAAEAKAWIRRARAKLVDLLGLERMKAASPQAQMTDSVDCGDHVRQRWLMRTEKHVTMPFFALLPKGATGRLPAVLCPHGHGGGGKAATAGVGGHPDIVAAIADCNYDYGVQFARAGFLAFCPDARGFGERQEKDFREQVIADSCHALQLMGLPQGITLAGMWAFDLMRLADHVLARPDVLPDRLGCAGLSGGGLQTLYFSAVDTRATCAVVSGYFYGARNALLDFPTNGGCNIIPHLWEYFDMGDLGAMIAPRALLIETGDQDIFNGELGVKNVLPQVAIARRAYRRLGAVGRIAHDLFPGPHRWHGVEAIPWMKKWLCG
jgi:dienelactone hydrolase